MVASVTIERPAEYSHQPSSGPAVYSISTPTTPTIVDLNVHKRREAKLNEIVRRAMAGEGELLTVQVGSEFNPKRDGENQHPYVLLEGHLVEKAVFQTDGETMEEVVGKYVPNDIVLACATIPSVNTACLPTKLIATKPCMLVGMNINKLEGKIPHTLTFRWIQKFALRALQVGSAYAKITSRIQAKIAETRNVLQDRLSEHESQLEVCHEEIRHLQYMLEQYEKADTVFDQLRVQDSNADFAEDSGVFETRSDTERTSGNAPATEPAPPPSCIPLPDPGTIPRELCALQPRRQQVVIRSPTAMNSAPPTRQSGIQLSRTPTRIMDFPNEHQTG